MKPFLSLTIVLLILGCSNREQPQNTVNDKSMLRLADTTTFNLSILNDKSNYIGFLDNFYFSKNNELYIVLYFIQDEISNEKYLKIADLADSLIYEDDENSRHKLPNGLSQKYFDLRGLSEISIYDNNNTFVCNANFVRVEYLSQNISPCFIAVYRPDRKIKEGNYYCISNFNRKLEQIEYSLITDTVLTKSILTRLNLPLPYGDITDNGTHIRYRGKDTTISIVNSDNFAYVVLVTGDKLDILYKSPEPENISSIQVVPLTKNQLPYLLTRNFKPESDISWDNLLYFDGKSYTSANRQRMN